MVESKPNQPTVASAAEVSVGNKDDMQVVLGQIETTVEAMLDGGEAGWRALSLDKAREIYARLERVRNRFAVVDAHFMQAFDNQIPVKEDKRCQWLNRECGVAARDARERVQATARLHPGNCEDRESEQFMPHLAALTRDGHAGQYAVAKVDRAVKSLPRKFQAEAAKSSDEYVAKLIAQGGPNSVDSLGLHLRRLVGADDYDDSDRARMRGITVGKQGPDGMSHIRGKITPRFAAGLQRLFADHSKAGDLADRMLGETGSDSDGGGSGFDASTDPRSPEQRRHDALEAALFAGFCREPGDHAEEYMSDGATSDHSTATPAVNSNGLVPRRGSTTLVAVTSLEELLQGKGDAFTDGGIHCSLESLIEGVDCRDLYLQILDFEGQTLHLGRSRRLGALSQYLALLGEERISTAPGTSAPAAFCDIHHIRSWESGGETNLDNLTLVDKHVHSTTDDKRIRNDRWRSYPQYKDADAAIGDFGEPKISDGLGELWMHAAYSGLSRDDSLSNNTGNGYSKVRWEPPDGHRSQGRGRKNLHPDAQPIKRQRPGVA